MALIALGSQLPVLGCTTRARGELASGYTPWRNGTGRLPFVAGILRKLTRAWAPASLLGIFEALTKISPWVPDWSPNGQTQIFEPEKNAPT